MALIAEKPSYSAFLAMCKEKGVKPPCRGRKKAVVLEELESVTTVTPHNPSVLKLTESPKFVIIRPNPGQMAIRDTSGGRVAMFPYYHGPRGVIYVKYAEACCAALSEDCCAVIALSGSLSMLAKS